MKFRIHILLWEYWAHNINSEHRTQSCTFCCRKWRAFLDNWNLYFSYSTVMFLALIQMNTPLFCLQK
jgi:hypothetical protein